MGLHDLPGHRLLLVNGLLLVNAVVMGSFAEGRSCGDLLTAAYLPAGAGTMTALGSTLGMPKWPLRWTRSRGRRSPAIWMTFMSREPRARTVTPSISAPLKCSQTSVAVAWG